ncbi:MAG: hypothetical protein LBC62_09175, partial [Treponema sp.]|nr:hypothetical protein [Treponema sp.]
MNVSFVMKDNIIPLSACLAKTIPHPSGKADPGIDVPGHCIITGEIAKEIVRRYFGSFHKELFPPGFELAASVHDVGKISPSFMERLYRNTRDYEFNSLPGLEDADPDLDKTWGGHAAVSQAALDNAPKYIPQIAGRHHGYLPTDKYPADYVEFGGE